SHAPDQRNRHFFLSSRRRHTRFSRDWSSDVCSSDHARSTRSAAGSAREPSLAPHCWDARTATHPRNSAASPKRTDLPSLRGSPEIGRASCRERGNNAPVPGTKNKEKRTQECNHIFHV